MRAAFSDAGHDPNVQHSVGIVADSQVATPQALDAGGRRSQWGEGCIEDRYREGSGLSRDYTSLKPDTES